MKIVREWWGLRVDLEGLRPMLLTTLISLIAASNLVSVSLLAYWWFRIW